MVTLSQGIILNAPRIMKKRLESIISPLKRQRIKQVILKMRFSKEKVGNNLIYEQTNLKAQVHVKLFSIEYILMRNRMEEQFNKLPIYEMNG